MSAAGFDRARALRKTRRQKERAQRIADGWMVCESPEARKAYRDSQRWWEKRKKEIAPLDPKKEKQFLFLVRRLRRMNWGNDDMERVRAAAWAVGIG